MAEQVCPHCDKVITDQDLAAYPIKLKKEQYRKDFLNSDVRRKDNILFGVVFILGLIGTFSPIVLMMFGEFVQYPSVLLVVEIVFGVLTCIWVVYSIERSVRLQDEYVRTRLESI